jgi:nicotinamidase-related amidase
MPHPNMLDSKKSALVVVDIQEAFRSAVPDFALIASRASIAVRGFQTLGVPVLITEQYPEGLGRTAEELLLVLEEGTEVFEKTAFSSCGAAPFIEKLKKDKVEQVVLCGLETHVCVNQTAHDLLDLGLQVHVMTDCVASRFSHDREAGISKMLAGGVIASSVEMALFELMRDSTHEKFKEIQALIR